MKTRLKLIDLEKISNALGVSIDCLIDAELDAKGGECLYLLWLEDDEDFKLYQKSTSRRMAYLEFEKKLNKEGLSLTSFVNPRVRVFVELVGIPVTKREMEKVFPKLGKEERLPK